MQGVLAGGLLWGSMPGIVSHVSVILTLGLTSSAVGIGKKAVIERRVPAGEVLHAPTWIDRQACGVINPDSVTELHLVPVMTISSICMMMNRALTLYLSPNMIRNFASLTT